MKSYLLLIKDKNEIYKEETSSLYLHEDAAYNYLKSKYDYFNENNLSTIELGIKGYISVSFAETYIFIVLPDKLNNDQKEYMKRKEPYLRKNISKLSIIDITKNNGDYNLKEYIGEDLYNEFDNLFERKVYDGYNIAVKRLKLT